MKNKLIKHLTHFEVNFGLTNIAGLFDVIGIQTGEMLMSILYHMLFPIMNLFFQFCRKQLVLQIMINALMIMCDA
jgi:hypothetical protein